MRIAVIGGGPAGLRAAEIAAAGGAEVTLFEAKASIGRKFLVAGRGGLNLTKAEPPEQFAAHYSGPDQPRAFWPQLIAGCPPDAVQAWAADLGIETFAASTRRVYPRGLKAAPLLRRWVSRLRTSGVQFETHHRWTGLLPGLPIRVRFNVKGEERTVETDALVLALGGGSWPLTGSDAGWTPIFRELGVAVIPFQPANCGWELSWPAPLLTAAEGQPLKNVAVTAGTSTARGELLITSYGLEGGALYQLSPELRSLDEPKISVDLKPDVPAERLAARLSGVTPERLLLEAKSRWRLSKAAFAVLEQAASSSKPGSSLTLATLAKTLPLRLLRPRPLAEAISSAGGVCWSELDENLMVRRLPGVFLSGEMIDWEAPTGGYLIHGCLATGAHAARGALEWLRTRV